MPNRRWNVKNEQEARKLRHQWRKTVYVFPSLITTANIFCGFYSVMESLLGIQSLALQNVAGATDHFNRAALNIGFATLFDFLDGNIARLTGATSEFGIELDAIADVMSFGIAPAVLAFAWGYGQVPGMHKVAWGVSFVFVICGALRLARFNVLARQPSPTPTKSGRAEKKAFVGMPIPAGASMLAAIVHFAPVPIAHKAVVNFPIFGLNIILDARVYAIAQLVMMFGLALLMISTIRYSSMKNLGSGNYHPRTLILAITLLGLCIWFYSEWSLLIIATIYSTHGLIAKLWSFVRPRPASAESSELELEEQRN